MAESLADRLRRAAAEAAAQRREAALRRSVGGFVRLHRELLLELRGTAGSWPAVAEILAAAGLRWRSGAPVTGAQLRSLIASTAPRAGTRPGQAARPPAVAPLEKVKPLNHDNKEADKINTSDTHKAVKGLADLVDTPKNRRT